MAKLGLTKTVMKKRQPKICFLPDLRVAIKKRLYSEGIDDRPAVLTFYERLPYMVRHPFHLLNIQIFYETALHD